MKWLLLGSLARYIFRYPIFGICFVWIVLVILIWKATLHQVEWILVGTFLVLCLGGITYRESQRSEYNG